MCIAIEKATNSAVNCEELRPDIDWSFLRSTAESTLPNRAD
nr:YdaS family helix-turn-helix protein [Wohlfahrtiimonas chitiniclastica]